MLSFVSIKLLLPQKFDHQFTNAVKLIMFGAIFEPVSAVFLHNIKYLTLSMSFDVNI